MSHLDVSAALEFAAADHLELAATAGAASWYIGNEDSLSAFSVQRAAHSRWHKCGRLQKLYNERDSGLLYNRNAFLIKNRGM
jgi:hypothetical protein